jgi:hypothetical protein
MRALVYGNDTIIAVSEARSGRCAGKMAKSISTNKLSLSNFVFYKQERNHGSPALDGVRSLKRRGCDSRLSVPTLKSYRTSALYWPHRIERISFGFSSSEIAIAAKQLLMVSFPKLNFNWISQ